MHYGLPVFFLFRLNPSGFNNSRTNRVVFTENCAPSLHRSLFDQISLSKFQIRSKPSNRSVAICIMWVWSKEANTCHFCLNVASRGNCVVFNNLIVLVVWNYGSNTNVAGMLKMGCYSNDGRFDICNICYFSIQLWYLILLMVIVLIKLFWAFINSKTVKLYYFCRITDQFLVANTVT